MGKTHRCSEQDGSDTRVPGGAVRVDPGHPLREARPFLGHRGQCTPPHRTPPSGRVSQRQGRRRTSVRPEARCALPRVRGPAPDCSHRTDGDTKA